MDFESASLIVDLETPVDAGSNSQTMETQESSSSVVESEQASGRSDMQSQYEARMALTEQTVTPGLASERLFFGFGTQGITNIDFETIKVNLLSS